MAELRPTILVIEDEPPLKKFLRITLESQDYTVIEATRGEVEPAWKNLMRLFQVFDIRLVVPEQ